MTEAELAAIEKRAAGPWAVAHAPDDIPALIAEIRRLWAIKEVHEELLKLFAEGTKSLFDERRKA